MSSKLFTAHHEKIKLVFFVINFNNSFASRDRPAAFPVNVTSIDDTKNFDEFPEVRFFISHKNPRGLIDVTLACEDANSKLVEVVNVANVDDEDRVGNSLLHT